MSRSEPARRRLGVVIAGLLIADGLLLTVVFLSSWSPAATGWWLGAGSPLRSSAGLIGVAGLAAGLVLPIVGWHCPGLLAGRFWRPVGWVTYGAYAVALAVYQGTFHAEGPPDDAHWSAALELRANALYALLLVLLALPLLYSARGPRRRETCASDG